MFGRDGVESWFRFSESCMFLNAKSRVPTLVFAVFPCLALVNILFGILNAQGSVEILLKCSIFIGLVPFVHMSIFYVTSNDKFQAVLSWETARETLEDPLIEALVARSLRENKTKSTLAIKSMMTLFWFAGLGGAVVFTPLISFLLGIQVFPLLSHFPVLEASSPHGYWINEGHQSLTIIFMLNGNNLAFGVFWIAAFHVIGSFEGSVSVLDLMARSQIDFGRGLEAVIRLHTDALSKLQELVELSQFTFMAVELAFFFDSFFIWIVLFVEKSSYAMIMCLGCIIPFYWGVVLISEEVRRQQEDFLHAVESFPWNELPPRERRDFVFVLREAQRVRGFSSGGFYEVTWERLKRLLNTLYSCILVLDKVIHGKA